MWYINTSAKNVKDRFHLWQRYIGMSGRRKLELGLSEKGGISFMNTTSPLISVHLP